MTRAARSPGETLRLRKQRDGSAPLLTWYGANGARTELSVSSFENWVAKTVNLLSDSGIGPGSVVRLDALRDHPAHWMALLWPIAIWDAGATIDLAATDPDLVVTGPAGASPPTTAPGFACSLDAWGRPCDPPAGLLDYTEEALSQPDVCLAESPTASEYLWSGNGGALTLADLLALPSITDRVLMAPSDARQALELLVSAVLGGGSVVLIECGDPESIAAAEQARLA